MYKRQEIRCRESYDYFNDDRPDYSGYLIQYTLDGKGRYCRGEKEWVLEKGMAFLVSFPEYSRYYLPQEQEEGWDFWYLHFDGAAAAPFADRIREMSGDVFYLDPGNEAVQMVLRMYKRLTGCLLYTSRTYQDSSRRWNWDWRSHPR